MSTKEEPPLEGAPSEPPETSDDAPTFEEPSTTAPPADSGDPPKPAPLTPAGMMRRARDRLRRASAKGTGAARIALVSSLSLSAVAGAAIAATTATRAATIAAYALLVAAMLGAGIFSLVRLFAWRDVRRAIHRTVKQADPSLAAAIDRALRLADSAERASASEGDAPRDARATQMLSELHLARQLRKISLDDVEARSARRGLYLAVAALGVTGALFGAVMLEPMRIVEGANLLASTEREAPFSLFYLDDVDIVSTPPAYLQDSEKPIDRFGRMSAPRGSVIAVRGRALRKGRSLVLTDGVREEPFVVEGSAGEGSGGLLIAKWTLGDSTKLHVAACFGQAPEPPGSASADGAGRGCARRIPQADTLEITSIPDEVPVVRLEGAPRTVRLMDTPSIHLKYSATDDHGIREVALVLRAGATVERRSLSRQAADSKTAAGGEELSTKDPFFKQSFFPVEVTIEVRDNDAVTGPKWGKSAAIVVVPPNVGEPEALRFAALLQIRDALVDLTAPRVARGETAPGASAPALPAVTDKNIEAVAEEEAKAQRAQETLIEDRLAESYGGLTIRGRIRTVIAGQLHKLDGALAELRHGATGKKPDVGTYASLVTVSEDALLAVDAMIRSQGFTDAAKVAKKLALVADDAANLARGFDRDADRESAGMRLDAALHVLEGGGAELLKIGDLGLDLGDAVRAGMGRIRRPRAELDMVRTEIAARDLAERLRHADASLGGGGRPGVESGGAPSSGGGGGSDEGEASDAASEAQERADELDDLIKKHAQQIGKVEDAMRKATTPEELDALKKLAKEEADAIRDAVKGLPSQGTPGSPSGRASDGRKHAEAMAGALEQGDVDEALKRGEEALRALRDAAERGRASEFTDEQELAKDATRSGNRIQEALDRMRDEVERMRRQQQERAKQDLEDIGAEEGRMGERAKQLREKGEKSNAPLSEEQIEKLEQAEEAMREAQRSLEQGEADHGKELEKQAQRLLEMAKGQDDDENENDGGESGDKGKRAISGDTKVPDKDKPKAPEDFQKRVTDGLSMPQDPRLREAIKRYAEGLVR
ncbi:MAG: DUF4175 domain-containing protein [Polyangiaceae bacterium]